MALSEHKGPSNSTDVFRHLVGEKIVACFEEDSKVWLVVESGHGFVVGGNGAAFAVYWRVDPAEVQRVIARRRKAIERHNAELRNLAGAKEL